ncbi:MAG TPA: hypothetical protein VMH39_15210, partial [Gemmatimonadaceae bacterium]|nr:hypothetical protein [Gemmatimonadaceae bacterium]
MTAFRAGLTLIVLGVGAAAAPAQRQPAAIRPIGSVEATAVQRFGVIEDLRVLPGGRVMVNDAERHQVVLLDSALANPVVVADSTDATARAYGPRPGGLIPYFA